MTTPAKPELPEPELGYIETDKSRQPAFSARQMREALQSAQPAAPQYNGWYCAHCQRGVDASEVTFHEQHTVCGRVITNDAPPALQPAAAVSDEEIDAAVLHATGFDGIGLQDMNRFDCRDIARAVEAHHGITQRADGGVMQA